MVKSFLFTDFVDYIVRTDEGQPRPKYIFNKCGTLFLLYRGLIHHYHRILNLGFCHLCTIYGGRRYYQYNEDDFFIEVLINELFSNYKQLMRSFF